MDEEFSVYDLISKAIQVSHNTDLLDILVRWNEDLNALHRRLKEKVSRGVLGAEELLANLEKPAVYFPENKINEHTCKIFDEQLQFCASRYVRLSDKRGGTRTFPAQLYNAEENLTALLTDSYREGIEELSINELCMKTKKLEGYLESIRKCPNNKKYTLQSKQVPKFKEVIEGLKSLTNKYTPVDNDSLPETMKELILYQYGEEKPKITELVADLESERVKISRQVMSGYLKIAFRE